MEVSPGQKWNVAYDLLSSGMKGGSWSLVGMSCFPASAFCTSGRNGTPVIPAAVNGPAPDTAKYSHKILARPTGAPMHVEFQESGTCKEVI